MWEGNCFVIARLPVYIVGPGAWGLGISKNLHSLLYGVSGGFVGCGSWFDYLAFDGSKVLQIVLVGTRSVWLDIIWIISKESLFKPHSRASIPLLIIL